MLGLNGSTSNYIRLNNIGGNIRVRISNTDANNQDYQTTYSWTSGEFIVLKIKIDGSNLIVDINGNDFTFSTIQTSGILIQSISRASTVFDDNKIYELKLQDDTQNHTFNLNESNGSTIYSTTSSLTGTINGASWLTGSPYGEQLYEWGWNRYTTGGVLDNTSGTVYITGETKDATTDINGNAIARPAIANFYNAPAYANHYAQLEELAGGEIDTSAAITTAFWINPQEGGTIYDNGAIKSTYNGTNLTFTRDGVTTITYAVALTELNLLCNYKRCKRSD